MEIRYKHPYYKYHVHYKGWNSRYDEIVKSNRLVFNMTNLKSMILFLKL